LLFIIVLEALSSEFRVGLPWELFYADDLCLIAETEEELMVKIKRWKEGMVTLVRQRLCVVRLDLGRWRILEGGHVECVGREWK